MKTYYQVTEKIVVCHGKPTLESITFNSTSEYFPFPVFAKGLPLIMSRFFHSTKEAEHYINFLYEHNPDYTAPRPVLDGGQLNLFQGA